MNDSDFIDFSQCWRTRAFFAGRDKAYEGICRSYWSDYIKENVDECILHADMKEWAEKKFQKGKACIFMITVNPRSDVKINDLHMRMKKALKKCYIEKWMYCYEWRNEDEGLHAHIRILSSKKKKKSEVQREFHNTFKHLVESVLCVNVIYGVKDNAFIDYVKGIKDGHLKDNAKYDRLMREDLGLKDWYESP